MKYTQTGPTRGRQCHSRRHFSRQAGSFCAGWALASKLVQSQRPPFRTASSVAVAAAQVRHAVWLWSYTRMAPQQLLLSALHMSEVEKKVSGQTNNAYRPGRQDQRWNPKQDHS